MKKSLAMLLAVLLVFGLCACSGGSTTDESETYIETMPVTVPTAAAKTVIRVMSFTDEVPGMVNKYMETHPDAAEKFDIKVTIVSTTDGKYQPALDRALEAGGEEAPDIYCAEAAFALKYCQGNGAGYAAAYEDLGLDVSSALEAADIAPYTVEVGTRPSDGKIVGLGYQSTGGAFIYRRSIAQEVFGTDDPEEIAKVIGAGTNRWDSFFQAAEKLKKKGYAIVSGDGDIWHAVENSSPTGWIVDGVLNIDPKREEFLDLSKKLMDGGYHHDTEDWSEDWYADMKKNSGVFGFYGPAWLLNYSIAPNSGEGEASSTGDWAVCTANVGFFWGGTWILANKSCVGSEKQQVVADILRWITLDCGEASLQYAWANGSLNGPGGTKDTVASGTVMTASDGSMKFLGGQNMFDVFVPANRYANGKNLTQYDETINTLWREAVRAYAEGTMTRKEAIASFKTAVSRQLDILVK